MLTLHLQKPMTVIILAALSFALTQRKYRDVGTRKRIAAVSFAFILAFFFASLIYMYRNIIEDKFIFIPALVTVGAIVLLRKRIFVFKNKCVECGKKVGLKKTLYIDYPRCPDCVKPEQVLKVKPLKKIKASIVGSDVEQINWETWEPKEKAVLCFIRKDDDILLIHKKTGLGKGKVNGPGGRVEVGESAVQAAVREVKEEVCLDVVDPEYVGELFFQFIDGYSLHCTVFSTDKFSGEAAETEEADPFWCNISEIPYADMWDDDQFWIPLLLKKEAFKGFFVFDNDTMLSKHIQS